MDYNTGYQYSTTGSGITASGNLSPTAATTNNVSINGVNSTWTGVGSKPSFTQTTPGGSVPVHGDLQRTRSLEPHDHPKNNRGHKRHRYYKYILAVIISGSFPSQTLAETIGGVSALLSPVAMLWQCYEPAIQVLQGPYITNTYGGGVQCQGPTRNFTPYVTGSASTMKPYEPYYLDPVYDVTDNFGAFDADGNPIGDGILDNPGHSLPQED